jgi:phosphoglycerate dehydrogenase-like enzyme
VLRATQTGLGSLIVTAPRIAIGPDGNELAEDAVRAAGGLPAGSDSPADALVWLAPRDTAGLRAALAATNARWVQLSSAGIEKTAAAGLLDRDRVWTSAKGVYADQVAEHALALALAGLRELPTRIAARSWGKPGGDSLFDEQVTILGAGGITASLLRLLAPFRVTATVVRHSAEPVPGAARTVPASGLATALPDAKVVFLALALTPETERIIGAAQLAAMRSDSWLVNVARGRHVDTGALVAALAAGTIAGAGLDVTDPEPLPDGHPLWAQQRCIITPHTADPSDLADPAFARRITDNVSRFAAGQPLLGLVDPAAGY